MEIKEVLKIIEEIYPLLPLWKDDLDNLISLFKSLETTIKGYEVAYTKAVLEKDKLKKELEAYKGMWEELYEVASEFNFFPLMDKIREEYLGGGE